MNKFLALLEMIKFEHTVFALPFAFLGAFLAAQGPPDARTAIWIILAMVGARSAAMAFNRQVDRVHDGLNPRTANRALPRGLVNSRFMSLFILASSALFLFSSRMLNDLAFYLSPLALALVFLYSYTKRFTALSHLFLGLSLAMAPLGGWIAVRGQFDVAPLWVAAAVLFWVGGFDIIYACLDCQFDRQVGLHSLPSQLGIRTSLKISAAFHFCMILLLAYGFLVFDLSIVSWIGLIVVGLGLVYEHSLVKGDDLTRVNTAFFTVNGVISVVLLIFVGLDLCLPA